MRWVALALTVLASGCVTEGAPIVPRTAPAPVAVPGDPDGAVYVVTNATVQTSPGNGVGYYITYEAGGHWHLRWTCDSAVSGYACAFDGTLTVAAGSAFANLAPFQLERNDQVWYTDATQTAVGFSTTASTASDGLDVDAPAGVKVSFDLFVDGVEYSQFVFLPSGDPAVAGDLFGSSPLSLPVTVLPSVP
jgi:hypothetical protein